MKTRVLTTVLGLPILFFILYFYNTWFFNVAVTIVSFIALYELINAFEYNNLLVVALPLVALTVILMFSNYIKDGGIYILTLLLTAVFYTVFFVVKNSVSIGDFFSFAIVYCIVLLCFFSLVYIRDVLQLQNRYYDEFFAIAICFVFAWVSDTFAYFAGGKYGKHKLAPQISPNKTVEGAIGGVVACAFTVQLVMLCYQLLSFYKIINTQITFNVLFYLLLFIVSVTASILGIMGDLFASIIKRRCKIKDFGAIFPGHGGLLDRFDSLLFITPFVAFIVSLSK